MTRPTIDETDDEQALEIISSPAQRNENALTLCGPGCACSKETHGGGWRLVIMLIVVAAVAIALIYRNML